MEFIHGARWWKVDFHTHTPKSFDYGRGNGSEKDISAKKWLLEHMSKNIDCVVISDHNSGEFIDELKNAYNQLKLDKPEGFREIFIFPGFELSVNGGIHIIGVFDNDNSSSHITKVIGECGYRGGLGDSNGVTSESLENIIEIIHNNNGIVIPAHVDKPCGLFSTQGETLKQIFKNNKDKLLALEVIDINFNFPEIYKQSKLNLAKIVGSDSHKLTDIGSKYTWVKMSTPSLDALKLALHDGEDGIIRFDDTPTEPNSIKGKYYVKSLVISKGFIIGNDKPTVIEFSPWFSSIIGGRGSGKSSLLNFLRIVLDRTSEMPDEIQKDFNSFIRIGNKDNPGMLRDETCIQAEIFKDETLYKVKWYKNQRTVHRWSNENNDWINSGESTNIKELFPAYIFSQKELYELTKNPSKIMELIDAQLETSKMKWLEEKKELEAEWLKLRAKKRKLLEKISEENNTKLKLSVIENKIKIYESSEYKSILENLDRAKIIETYISQIVSNTKEVNSNLIKLKEKTIEAIPLQEKDLNLDEETEKFINELEDTINKIDRNINESLLLLEPYNNLDLIFEAYPWKLKVKEAKDAYQEIQIKIDNEGEDSYSSLLDQRNELLEKIKCLNTFKEELISIEQELINTYESIINMEKNLRHERQKVLIKWKEEGENDLLLNVELDLMADLENAEKSFRKIIRKENGEFNRFILKTDDQGNEKEGLIARIINSDSELRWDVREKEINDLIKITECNPYNIDTRLVRHIENLCQDNPEDIDKLIIWVPEDKVSLKLIKEGQEMDIQTGSAGERAASMLALLLILNKNPIIIDQPEDDLDTSLISSFVVNGFKMLKKNRQLIVVTHNSNIVVNANSDNIISMKYKNGQITVLANDALQNKNIRSSVCEVMEGGEEALAKRYFRILKALN